MATISTNLTNSELTPQRSILRPSNNTRKSTQRLKSMKEQWLQSKSQQRFWKVTNSDITTIQKQVRKTSSRRGLQDESQLRSKIMPEKTPGCIACGKPNIQVEYYGQRHVCVQCRTFVTDDEGNQVRIFLNDNEQIVVLGVFVHVDGIKRYYHADPNKLYLGTEEYYATYAGLSELVVVPKAGI